MNPAHDTDTTPAPGERAEGELPPTPLAAFVEAAKAHLGTTTPDTVTPHALSTLAAVVRDLKGLPELAVSRDGKHHIRLGRRGRPMSISLQYDEKIRAFELTYERFPDASPLATKFRRFALTTSEDSAPRWQRMDESGELFEDIKEALKVLYPEMGP